MSANIIKTDGVVWMAEAKDSAKHPAMHRMCCATKKQTTENVNKAKTEKAHHRISSFFLFKFIYSF